MQFISSPTPKRQTSKAHKIANVLHKDYTADTERYLDQLCQIAR